ncbi:MAG: hypothetical protein ABID09_02470 [Candidatus Omnitrophota bacterium]
MKFGRVATELPHSQRKPCGPGGAYSLFVSLQGESWYSRYTYVLAYGISLRTNDHLIKEARRENLCIIFYA